MQTRIFTNKLNYNFRSNSRKHKFKSFFLIFLVFFSFRVYPNSLVPNLPIYDLEDERYLLHSELDASSAKLLVLNFTSTNCKPCEKEIPELIEEYNKYSSRGLELWIVFVGDFRPEIEKKVQMLNIPSSVRILKDSLEISYKRMGFKAVPTTYVISKDKNIQLFIEGYNEASFSKLKKFLAQRMTSK